MVDTGPARRFSRSGNRLLPNMEAQEPMVRRNLR
jgi:hypothetical protein